VAFARTGWAQEHDKHEHDKKEHAHQAPHGGLVQTAGKYHVELVAKDAELNVYLLDHAEKTLPISIKGREVKTVLLVPKRQKQDLILTPTGEYLRAAVNLKGVDAFVAIVSLTLDGTPQNTRFSWKRKKEAAVAHEHSSHQGGVIGMSGDLHVEAVAYTSGEIRVYLSDAFRKPLSGKGVTGEAEVLAPGGKAIRLRLAHGPQGAYLRARTAELTAQSVEVTVWLHGRHEFMMTFPLTPRASPGAGSK
jgi:hypothetical protein